MPTGSGKTWLAQQTMLSVLNKGQRAIYLTPLRALAEELYPQWQQQFKPFKVGIFTGDYGATRAYPVSFLQAQLLVMTPERLDFCLRQWRKHWGWLPEVDLVVVDEFHLLGDGRRGAGLEGTLSRFRALNPFLTIHGLSATLGNRDELGSWLQGLTWYSDVRPIPLSWKVESYRKATEKPELLKRILEKSPDVQTVVFVQSRKRAESLSKDLNHWTTIPSGYHHAGLPHGIRKEVETKFRKGELTVLFATSTVEMGVNLPARRVILYDLQQFNGHEFKPLLVNSVWQRAGRAGRLGLDDQGEVILLASPWEKHLKQYLRGQFEAIHSQWKEPRWLMEQIIVEVGCGFAHSEEQLERRLRQSLGYQQHRISAWRELLQTMLQAGLLELYEKDLKVTPLARIAIRHQLLPDTVLQWQELRAEPLEEFSFFDWLLLASSSADTSPVLSVDYEELPPLQDFLSQQPSHLLSLGENLIEALQLPPNRLLSALKMAAALRFHTLRNEENPFCTGSDWFALKESVERILLALRAWSNLQISSETDQPTEDIPSIPQKLNALHIMIVGGFDEHVATLPEIEGIGVKWAQNLAAAGVNDIEDLALSEPEILAQLQGLSLHRAQRWVEEAEVRVSTVSAFAYCDQIPPATLRNLPKLWNQDPYRLRRAVSLEFKQLSSTKVLIWGGLEPHELRYRGEQWFCDCADADRGNHCKHMIRLEIELDAELASSVQDLLNPPTNSLSLEQLWMRSPSSVMRKSA